MDKLTLLNEIRYAERLCARTARLYRHMQSGTVFFTVLGGSGVITALSSSVPKEVAAIGAVLFAVFGALNLAIRPADKAAANDNDTKRYAQLRTTAHTMSVEELAAALAKARESDTQEVESLRDVAYNDVVVEMGRPDAQVSLSGLQKLLGAVA